MSATPAWTHIAIRCADLGRSIAFYRDWCGMAVVHRRSDPSPDGKGSVEVAWMAPQHGGKPVAGVWIVLLQAPRGAGATSLFDHLGMALDSRAAVDAVAARGKKEGILHWPAEDMGGVVGYLCAVKDPDGNVVEFSHGQTIPHAP